LITIKQPRNRINRSDKDQSSLIKNHIVIDQGLIVLVKDQSVIDQGQSSIKSGSIALDQALIAITLN